MSGEALVCLDDDLLLSYNQIKTNRKKKGECAECPFLGRWDFCSKDALVIVSSIRDSFLARSILGKRAFFCAVSCVIGLHKLLFHHCGVNSKDCEGFLQRC